MGDKESGRRIAPCCPVCARPLEGDPLCPSSRPSVDDPPNLWSCPGCGLTFSDRDYSAAGMEDYFDTAVYVVPENERRVRRHKQGMFEDLLRRANAYFPAGDRPRRILDFGCSYGHLGMVFKDAGWSVVGVDIAPSVAARHRELGTFEVFPDLDTPEIPDGCADVIAMIDVLYYLQDPVGLLTAARRKLADRGVVFLRVPNRNRLLLWGARLQRAFGGNWVGRIECDHKTYWTWRTVRVAAERAGFDEVRILRRERGYWYPFGRKALHWGT